MATTDPLNYTTFYISLNMACHAELNFLSLLMTSPKTWKENKLTAFKHLIKVTACWYNTYINRALVDKQIH
jgi:hypothetical protein